jgi:hypothetical protein
MAPKRAASKQTQKVQKQTPLLQDAQPQPRASTSDAPRERYNLLTPRVSLDDCIRNTREIEAAETATTDQPADEDMQQAGPSRAVSKGKSAMTPSELEANAKAEFHKGLNPLIERFGQHSAEVSAYRWSRRHRQPVANYTSSVDSEKGHNNTDADAEYAALLQAEETENSQKQADQVVSDRQAAERLQSQLQSSVSQQLDADRLYAQALSKGANIKTRAAAKHAAAAHSTSAKTQDTQAERVQVQTENDALRAKISELQANLDHERSAKRTAKVIEPQFPTHAEANAIADELYNDFEGAFQQAEIPSAPLPRKMPSSQAGPSRIDRLATIHEPASAAPQAQANIKQNFMDMRNDNRPPVRQFPTGAAHIASTQRIHNADNRTAAASAPQAVAPVSQTAAGGPQAHRHPAAVQHTAHNHAPFTVPAYPRAPAYNAFATHAAQAPATAAATYTPFSPAPQAAALSAPATAAAGYHDRDPDPDLYFHKTFQQLTAAEKKQVKRNLNDSIYMTFDEFSKDQDCTPEAWLSHLGTGLRNNSVNPDHAVRFFRDQHLGNRTARSLASWITNNPEAGWDLFQQAFLERNPGKPPQVTRASWKAITMKSCGTYHAYLQEFNRQKALISTGADEVVEQFLAGLSVQLRTQVEFLKNRNWQADEFDELVKATTERVNSSVSSSATASENRPSPQSAKHNNKKGYTTI